MVRLSDEDWAKEIDGLRFEGGLDERAAILAGIRKGRELERAALSAPPASSPPIPEGAVEVQPGVYSMPGVRSAFHDLQNRQASIPVYIGDNPPPETTQTPTGGGEAEWAAELRGMRKALSQCDEVDEQNTDECVKRIRDLIDEHQLQRPVQVRTPLDTPKGGEPPSEQLATMAWVARRAAAKLATMYVRGEVSPRSELDELIDFFGKRITAATQSKPREGNDK